MLSTLWLQIQDTARKKLTWLEKRVISFSIFSFSQQDDRYYYALFIDATTVALSQYFKLFSKFFRTVSCIWNSRVILLSTIKLTGMWKTAEKNCWKTAETCLLENDRNILGCWKTAETQLLENGRNFGRFPTKSPHNC